MNGDLFWDNQILLVKFILGYCGSSTFIVGLPTP